jgi:hypothetical protein
MPDQILKEVTHLGSTLAELATKQLDAVIGELRGAAGDGRDPHDHEPPRRVNAGTMAFNVLQLVSKAGTLLTQLSEYDLVRRNVPALTLRSSNPLTNLTLQADTRYPYELLVENEGVDELKTHIKAEIFEDGKDEPLGEIELEGKFRRIFPSERRRISAKIPELSQGRYSLSFTITQGEDEDGANVIGKKTIILNVLAAPQQHNP